METHCRGNANGVTAEERAGRVLAGRYEIGPVIGVGSTATVHRGHDLRDDLPVAVKLFHPGASADDVRRQRRETDALAGLGHPGLVGLRDGGVDGEGRPFVVTDLVEGPTLAERIADAPLPPSRVARLGAELADALAHVHDGGVVHRDVKPANVLLGDGTRARLADFGIAKAVDAGAITGVGTVIGTAAFLAPEQARGEHVGPAADVYSLGLVMLEALTGRREYPGGMIEAANARLHRRPVVPDGLPDGLTGLLRAMTADDPRHRPSAAAVAAQLAPGDAAPRPARHRARSTRRRVAVPLAAAALLLVAVGGGAMLLTGSPDAPDAETSPVAVEPER